MNLIQRQLFLYTPTGELLTIILDGGYSSLNYGFKELEAGVLELVLPGNFDLSLLAIDGIIEIYRSYGDLGLQLEGDTAFFIRHPIIRVSESGVKTIYVKAFSAFEIVKRRIVAYYAGTSYSEKTRYSWDDLMRKFMQENYGSEAINIKTWAADPDRDLSP